MRIDQRRVRWTGVGLCLAWLVAGCRPGATATPVATPTAATPAAGAAATGAAPVPGPGLPVTPIPLGGQAASAAAQMSGLAWWRDWLVLLPQYPSIEDEEASGVLFALPRGAIEGLLDGTVKGPLLPSEVSFDAAERFWETGV